MVSKRPNPMRSYTVSHDVAEIMTKRKFPENATLSVAELQVCRFYRRKIHGMYSNEFTWFKKIGNRLWLDKRDVTGAGANEVNVPSIVTQCLLDILTGIGMFVSTVC